MSLTDGTYYGPVDESPQDIFLEKTFLASGYLTGVGYGVQLVLYGACVKKLWRRKPRIRFTLFLISYITVLCIMNTIWTATSAYGLQLTYIDYRNYPGGSLGFLRVEFSLPSNVLSLAAYITGNILADALLLWRCRVIWTAAFNVTANFVMIIPMLMLFGSFAVAVVFAIETASPEGLFSQTTTNFALPYFAISLSLNIILTLLIVGRMWFYQREGRAVFGQSYGKHYASISAMFIESAALYAICSILLLATYAIQHPINQIWFGLSPSVQMIANYLIIYRVADGRAWSSEMFTKATGVVSSIAFDSNASYNDTPSRNNSEPTTTTVVSDSRAYSVPLQTLGIVDDGVSSRSKVDDSSKVSVERSSVHTKSRVISWVQKEEV